MKLQFLWMSYSNVDLNNADIQIYIFLVNLTEPKKTLRENDKSLGKTKEYAQHFERSSDGMQE